MTARAADAATQAAVLAAKRRTLRAVDSALEKVMDVVAAAADKAADVAAEYAADHPTRIPEPPKSATGDRAAAATPLADAASPAEPVLAELVPDAVRPVDDVADLEPHDEVFVRATFVRLRGSDPIDDFLCGDDQDVLVKLPWREGSVALTWVRADAVYALPHADLDFVIGAVYAAKEPTARAARWMFLPQSAADPQPFIAVAGEAVGQRNDRRALPKHLVEVVPASALGL
jgi:hypothetical protein